MSVTWGGKGASSGIWWLVIGIITLAVIITAQQKGTH